MRKFFKRNFDLFGAVIALIATFAFFISEGDGSTEEEEEEVFTELATAEIEETFSTSDEKESVYYLGDTVRVGEVEYTIHGVDIADTVGPSLYQEKANDTYLILDMTFKNHGEEPIYVYSSFIKLKHGVFIFEVDEAASVLASHDIDRFLLREVQPGASKSGKVVFDVEEDIAVSEHLQVFVQSDLFSQEVEVIRLYGD